MRGSNTISDRAALVEYVPAAPDQPLDLHQLFDTAAPLELDLGCGDGSFLSALAAQHPERNFIGIERLRGRVASACRKIAARGLTNARIVRVDIGHAVAELLPESSVEVCHVMFPDPWPKRRHHRRRTITEEFLRTIARVLAPAGLVRLTTDDRPYFEQMQDGAAAVSGVFEAVADDGLALPRSTFERRFVDRALPIHRLVLRKVPPVR